MSKTPITLPGSELLNPSMGKGSTTNKEIFTKPKDGGDGLGRAKKPAPVSQEAAEDLVPEPVQPPPEKVYPVIIFNPKWMAEEAYFGDLVKVVVDVEIPKIHSHLTRVVCVLHIIANGKPDKIATIEVHAKDKKAQGEFKIPRPKDYKSGEAASYVFTASHKEAAKEVQSAKLKVTEPLRNLICELDEYSEISQKGYSLVLKGGGKIHSKFTEKDGVEKKGVLAFDFKGLDAEVKYALELQNEKGKVVAQLFSEKKHGDWHEASKSP